MTTTPKVIKRDGRVVKFDRARIFNAIFKAAASVHADATNEASIRIAVQAVEDSLKDQTEVDISDIQNAVETALLNLEQKSIARAYIGYRRERDIVRERSSTLMSEVEGLINRENKSLLNENANKDSKVIPTQRDLLAGIVSRHYAIAHYLPEHIGLAHKRGDIHYHDLDYAPFFPMFNCMLVDLKGMLETGFRMGNAEIETPKSISTACAVTAQIVAQVASHIYGGTSLNRLDEVLEPYVKASYAKHQAVAKQYGIKDAKRYAQERTEKECKDAFQALEYEVNTLHTANGQTPFVTFGFGLGKSWAAKLIQRSILETRIAGLGKHKKTAVFPKLVFAIKDGINHKPTDPNYDIKQIALECTSKRIYPDILNYDRLVEATGSFKTPMGCVDGVETVTYHHANGDIRTVSFETFWDTFSKLHYVKTRGVSEYIDDIEELFVLDNDGTFTEVRCLIRNPDQGNWMQVRTDRGFNLMATADHPLPVVGKGRIAVESIRPGDILTHRDGSPLSVTKVTPLGNRDRYSYDVTTESDTFVVSNIQSHNCRSFLSKWTDEQGNEVHDGRNNLGVVTLNLPRVAIEAGKDIHRFWEILDERLELCHHALRTRIDRLEHTKASVAPILYVEGACGVRLKPDDLVGDIFKNGRASISLGYIGVHETIKALYGADADLLNDTKLQDVAKSIVARLRKACDQWKKEEGYGYSLYSTPSENLCDRFCRLDRELYGPLASVTDKGYYTNSFHLDVRTKADPYSKILFEKDYPAIANGGFISYGEFPNLQHNLKAIEDVWDFAYKHTPYYGTNTPVDECYLCGYQGEFSCTSKGYECPSCGNHDPKQVSVIRRVSGYLGSPDARPFNEGKQHEVMLRVKHVDGSVTPTNTDDL